MARTKKAAAKDGLTGVAMTSAEIASRTKNALKLDITAIGADDFMVRGQGKKSGYNVSQAPDGKSFECACTDYYMHQHRKDWRCKHVLATEAYVKERGPTIRDSRYATIEI